MGRNARAVAVALLAALVTGCAAGPAPVSGPPPGTAATAAPGPPTAGTPAAGTPAIGTPTAGTPTAGTPIPGAPTGTRAGTPVVTGAGATAAPGWLGTRVLPAGPDGYPLPVRTPPELVDRRIVTVDVLPPPAGGFRSTVIPVPAAVQARSTWSARCPVTLAELRYVTVSFRGFDGRPHTGELMVHRDVAAAVVTVFARLWAARFPIERMRVPGPADLTAPPTGDGNTTAAFVCRAARGTTTWSAHAYGKAVDVNPFQNPYVRGDRVLPELATAYLDRTRVRPGMVTPAVVAAFRAVGWTWGGDWTSPRDRMHFTATGG